jgi:hypothetical protein
MNATNLLRLIGCAVFSLILGASSVQAKSGMSGGFSSSSSSGGSRSSFSSSSGSSYKSPSSVSSREMAQSASQKRALDNYDARSKHSAPASSVAGNNSASAGQSKSEPSKVEVYHYGSQSNEPSFFNNLAWFMLGHELFQNHQQAAAPVVIYQNSPVQTPNSPTGVTSNSYQSDGQNGSAHLATNGPSNILSEMFIFGLIIFGIFFVIWLILFWLSPHGKINAVNKDKYTL